MCIGDVYVWKRALFFILCCLVRSHIPNQSQIYCNASVAGLRTALKVAFFGDERMKIAYTHSLAGVLGGGKRCSRKFPFFCKHFRHIVCALSALKRSNAGER
jgi:hypothetical protein